MESRPRFLAFLLLFVTVFSSSNGIPHDAPAIFSDTYSLQGTLYIPYAEIREPFYAWYDLSKGSSRIDYYGGMVKTYQLSKSGEFGTSLKIAPITTEDVANEMTCLQVNGSALIKIEPQSILPDLTEFKHVGEEMINGLTCHKWRLTDTNGDKMNKYTMWTRIKGTSTPNQTYAIPVRYEMKGYNTLLGSHYDHYYLEYEYYSPDSPNPDVFNIPKNMTCQSFPGPGEDHIYTFNPIREFVNNEDKHVHNAFHSFQQTHNKQYDTIREHHKRLEVFRQNMRFIHSKNRAGLKYRLSVNHLADKSDLELRALRGNKYTPGVVNNGQPFPYSQEKIREIEQDLPESMDWRINGAVTPVKDQSVCGSCWSFGTTGTLEGAYFLKYGKLVRLSQQALIDCSWGFGNNGCDGGEDFRSYDWMMKHGGIPTEDEYGPYLGQDGFCHMNATTLVGPIKGYVNVTSGDQSALKVAVSVHGPISVAIDASHKTFAFYSKGVYYEPQCGNTPDQLDHAVLVVGYGKLNGEEYWLVKNSWSNYWGNDGYVLMSLKDNNCGVATDPTIRIDANEMEILNSGLMRIHAKDILMVFYVTVQHQSDDVQKAVMTMVECCEVINDGETDCDFMTLYGSRVVHLEPRMPQNMTLFYPNMYGYNRKGSCLVSVWHRTANQAGGCEIRRRIDFDTMISGHSVPPALQGLYNPNTLAKCETPDLDPFDFCNPVKCEMKYSGHRNYFNRNYKRCQKVPVCISDPNKELPDIVYVATNNICRNMANSVTEDDLTQLVQGLTRGGPEFYGQMINIRCLHGGIDPKTGLCVCDYGWKSEAFDADTFNPNSVYVMCNIECFTGKNEKKPSGWYSVLGIILAMLIVLCVVAFENRRWYSKLRRCCVNSSQGGTLFCSMKEEQFSAKDEPCDSTIMFTTNAPPCSKGKSHSNSTVCNMVLVRSSFLQPDEGTPQNSDDDKSLWDITR